MVALAYTVLHGKKVNDFMKSPNLLFAIGIGSAILCVPILLFALNPICKEHEREMQGPLFVEQIHRIDFWATTLLILVTTAIIFLFAGCLVSLVYWLKQKSN